MHVAAMETLRPIQIAVGVVATLRQVLLVGAFVVVRVGTQNTALHEWAPEMCSH